ncbi:hypothetical protein GGH99_004699 [Coemansia sp. RSA 1285]|nr:hypothetical protein GGH99_004699 [Coemansia sp. RSA 1285]
MRSTLAFAKRLATGNASILQAATAIRSAPLLRPNQPQRYQQTRGYPVPIVHEDASLETEQDVPSRIKRLVWPSSYTHISMVREAAHAARTEKKGTGRETAETAQSESKRAVGSRLDEMFRQEMGGSGRPREADLLAFLDGYYAIGDTDGCIAVLFRMRECGVTPTRPQYAMVLKLAARAHDPSKIYLVGEEMGLAGLEDTNENYDTYYNALVECLANNRSVELAYSVYLEMRERGMVPKQYPVHYVVARLAEIGELDLALQVVDESARDSTTLMWFTHMLLLSHASFYMHYGAYRAAFEQLHSVFGMQITKGNYDAGLSIASMAGDYRLVTTILSTLGRLGFPVREREYEALFDSLLVRGNWETAFKVLGNMRKTGYGRTPRTLRTLTRALAKDHKGGKDRQRLIGQVYDVLVETSAAMPEVLDTTTLNALVAASALAQDYRAVTEQLETWFERHSVRRNIDTYTGVLGAFIQGEDNKAAAVRVLAMMLDVDGIGPTKEIYELMIHLSLRSFNYEDAFVYLESMRAQKLVPGWRAYAAIVKRCAHVRDPRAAVALDEMRRLGYAVTPSLEALSSFGDYGGKAAGAGADADADADGGRLFRLDPPEKNKDKDKDEAGLDSLLMKDILRADAFKT